MRDTVFSCEATEAAIPALRAHLQASPALPETAATARLKLQLIVEELFTNSMRHGGGGTVRISLEGRDGLLELCFEDSCPPFNPFTNLDLAALQKPVEERSVGQLGLILIRAFAERATHEPLPAGNRLRLSLRY